MSSSFNSIYLLLLTRYNLQTEQTSRIMDEDNPFDEELLERGGKPYNGGLTADAPQLDEVVGAGCNGTLYDVITTSSEILLGLKARSQQGSVHVCERYQLLNDSGKE